MTRSINLVALLAAVAMAATACGDTATTTSTQVPEVATTTTVESTSTLAPTTTPSTTTTVVTTTTLAPTTTVPPVTTVPGPSAVDDLAAFFAAAESLDAEIAAAAALFNAGFDEAAATLAIAAVDAIAALNAGPVADLIPAGLSIDLETAVLAVYADLQSRIAALDGGARYLNQGEFSDVEFTKLCLGLGSDSNARFDDDLAAAKAAAATSPQPTAAADSEAAGVLAVRIETIVLMNWGCDNCGGGAVDEPIAIDWAGRTVMDGVGFEAAFTGGAWDIMIFAC